jgi:hypothetical protein
MCGPVETNPDVIIKVDASEEEYFICPFKDGACRGGYYDGRKTLCRAWVTECGIARCPYSDSECSNCQFGKPHCRRLE